MTHQKQSTQTVLVIDDVALIRTMVRETLTAEGFDVIEAATGDEGLLLAEELRPDLILLDLILPGRDGFSICRELRERSWGQRLPVVMITMLEDLESIQKAFDAGATDFITKPINWGILGYRLNYILRASQAEDRIHSLSYFDPLTGLSNRRHFIEQTITCLASSRLDDSKVAFLLLGLDRLKNINETLGHSVGDRILQEVANRLRYTLRHEINERFSDDLLPHISRLGGDEFIVTLVHVTEPAEIVSVAQRLQQSISHPIMLEGYEFFPSTSIGISVSPDDGSTVEELLKNADMAMHHAKDGGRNSFRFYTPAMNAAAMERLLLEANLRRAINRREFTLHYQPQVDAQSGTIIGLESLIRWNSLEYGAIPPDRFIPLAEETDIIFDIDEWVLTSVCCQIRLWDSQGTPPVRVAVNLSGRHFTRKTLLPLLDRILAETGVDGNRLELEITENALMREGKETMEVLAGLRTRGISVSVDDFGTGYSSLSHLRRFPIDTLKIDRSFILDTPGNPDSMAIASAIIALGKSLNLKVIAEGVETQEQRAFLKNNGCPLIQGFLYSPPLSAEDILPLLDRRSITLD